MATIRLLLKSNVTRGDVEFMALDYDWQLYTQQAQTESQGAYKVWIDGEGESQSVIIYTEDSLAELRYVSVEGAHAEACADKIRVSVEVYTREELAAGIAGAKRHDDRIQALRRLGASLSQTYEAWAFALLCEGLEHEDPRVRLAAIAAMGFPAWEAFIEPIGKIQETDTDARVLRRAARMLALLQQAQTPRNGDHNSG